MIAPFVDDLMQLVGELPFFLPIILVLACVGLGFCIIRLGKTDTWDEGDEACVRRRDMAILACIGVDLFMIAYVAVAFLLFQFLIDHVELLG